MLDCSLAAHMFFPCRSFFTRIAMLASTIAICPSAFAQSVTTTTLTITSSGSAVTSVAAGTVVTLTATVVSGSTPVTSGQVEFCDASAASCTDIHLLGLAQLTTSGTAIYKFRPGGGSPSFKVLFLGTTAYAKSSSSASSLNVTGPFPSVTQIQDSYQGSSWNLTALVAGGGSAKSLSAPTGTVSFVDTSNSNAVLATEDLSSGSASTSLSYRGDLLFSDINPYYEFIVLPVDINGDGIPDMVVESQSPAELEVFFGNGDGTFRQGPVTALPSIGYTLLAADFNQDGIPDLAVQTDTAMLIFLGNGDGSFNLKTPVLSNPVNYAFGAFVGDFNGDGIPDFLMTLDDGKSTTLVNYQGNGDGTFTAQTKSTVISYLAGVIQVADFNGDGILDLMVEPGAANFTENAAILLGNGDGTFTAQPGLELPATSNMVFADFNGDGILDIAIESIISGNYPTYTGIQIMTGNGDGTFSNTTTIPIPNTLLETPLPTLLSGDFNGDGIADLAIVYQYSSTPENFYLYLGNGDGTFSDANVLANPNIPGSANVIGGVDLNGDGLSDIIEGNAFVGPAPNYTTSYLLSTFLAQSGFTATATVPNVNFSLGNHVVSATYSGDSNYKTSTAGTVTITAATATLSAPAPGSVLPGGNITFSWSAGPGASQYQLLLGTTGAGSSNLYAGSPTTATSTVVPLTGLPFNGATVYATLLSEIDGTWYSTPYTYTEAQAPITSPVPGSKLSGSSVTFTWTPESGVTNYQLLVGSNWPGGDNIYGSPISTGTSATVTGLPTDGVTLYITVRYQMNNIWAAVFYTYKAAGSPTPPALTTPAPGSHLTSSTATFQWSPGSGVSSYLLNVGTLWPGSGNIYGSGVTTATSATVTGLPTDGVTVYVMLRYEINGVWNTLYYTYTAEGTTAPPVLTTPAPGSQLTGSTATFQWTPGTGVTAYKLLVGTYGPGYFNIYGSGTTTATSGTATDLPTNGKPVYVTLEYQIDGVWNSLNYTYTTQ
jgi:FG-GAP-like repeat/Bacterial Ig-like domain (group 3)